MSDRVVTTIENRVATVTLNRPEKRNGLDLAMFEGLVAAGEAVIADKSVRAVVLRGEGPSFCAGLDFAWFMANPDAGSTLLDRPEGPDASPANLAQRMCWVWQEVPVPVVAAMHGHAYGGGLQLALAADVRVVAPDTKLSVMEINYGLIPDMSITQTLLRLVPVDVAKLLVFTGRVFSGEEAVALGVATETAADPNARAQEIATEIASKSPDAMRAAKRMLNEAKDLDTRAGLARETELQMPLLGSANQLEAVQAKLMKRAAEFRDPE